MVSLARVIATIGTAKNGDEQRQKGKTRVIRKTGSMWIFLAKITLIIIIIGIFYIGQMAFYAYTRFYFWGNYIVLMLYVINLYFTSRIFRGMSFGSIEWQEGALSWVLCLTITNGLQYLLLSLLESRMLPVSGILFVFGAQLILIVPLTYLVDKLYYNLHPAHKAIIIYGDEHKANAYCQIIKKHRKKFEIERIISQSEPLETVLNSIEEAESVFFLDVDENHKGYMLEYCYLHDKRMYILPTFSGVLLNSAEVTWISRNPMFLPRSPKIDPTLLFIKRIMDIVISTLVIIALSWLMFITWAAILLCDRKPAIYKQTRITRGEKHFTLYKFRSMRPDAEADGIPRLSTQHDDRVTPIGRFIRKTRIDELPQLFNVLMGSMSLVGPRPERPEIAGQYRAIYPSFSFRTKVKAGLTGYAQIYGRYNTAPDEKLFLDLMYIERFSIWQDIKLIFQTLKVVFMTSSTEGIREDEITALRKN